MPPRPTGLKRQLPDSTGPSSAETAPPPGAKRRRYEWAMRVDVTLETKITVRPQTPTLTVSEEDVADEI